VRPKGDPHEARRVVDHEKEVASATWSRRCHWTAQVVVDELQGLLDAVQSLLVEGTAAQLGDDPGVYSGTVATLLLLRH